jgi:hypothetical protein
VDGRYDVCAIGDGTAHVVGAFGADALHKQAGVLVE